MEEFNSNIEQNGGVVKISDEVVSVIAGIAADEVDGITVCHQGVTNKLFKGKKTAGKATRVTLVDDTANIEMSIAVEYGVKIKEAVSKIQDNVKTTVEAMTGLQVGCVNVKVTDIYLKDKQNEKLDDIQG